jgi:serine O-acetyltransferase
LSTSETRPAQTVSADVADWSREARTAGVWQPSRALLASIRQYQRHAGRSGALHALTRRYAVLKHRFWSVVTGADIPVNCPLGGGLLLPHPNGVVIHPDTSLGVNCLVFQQVTIGAGSRPGVPRIGGHVDIGAGAKILGGVAVGDHARIGANAVVIDDVPAGATAVGIPARLVGTAR